MVKTCLVGGNVMGLVWAWLMKDRRNPLYREECTPESVLPFESGYFAAPKVLHHAHDVTFTTAVQMSLKLEAAEARVQVLEKALGEIATWQRIPWIDMADPPEQQLKDLRHAMYRLCHSAAAALTREGE